MARHSRLSVKSCHFTRKIVAESVIHYNRRLGAVAKWSKAADCKSAIPRFESGRRLLLLMVASGRTTSLNVFGSMTSGSTTFLFTPLASSPPVAPIRSVSRPHCCAMRCTPGDASSVPVAVKASGVGSLLFAAGRASSWVARQRRSCGAATRRCVRQCVWSERCKSSSGRRSPACN